MPQYLDFNIKQQHSAMKVTSDSILLGKNANVEQARRVLDIGTGTGILSLIVASRNAACNIVAVEIDKQSAKEALHNFQASNCAHRITLINKDISQYAKEISKTEGSHNFDYIICNPPYFPAHEHPNGTEGRRHFGGFGSSEANCPCGEHRAANARHTITLTYSILMECVNSLLSSDGVLGLIVPAQVSQEVRTTAFINGLYLLRHTTLSSARHARVLMEFSRELHNPVCLSIKRQ